jgi:hypothetical protein
MYDKIIIVTYKKKLNLFGHFGKNLIFCSKHFGEKNSTLRMHSTNINLKGDNCERSCRLVMQKQMNGF